MKFTRRDAAKLLALPVIFHLSGSPGRQAQARTSLRDPAFREAVQAAMLEYIDATAKDGHNLIFDPIKGDFVPARFVKLHKNLSFIAGRFYVSCADFTDPEGHLIDIDYMVADHDGYFAVFQSVIHKRDGKMRDKHMEDVEVIYSKAEGCCAAGCGAKQGCCAAICGHKGCCAATCGHKG